MSDGPRRGNLLSHRFVRSGVEVEGDHDRSGQHGDHDDEHGVTPSPLATRPSIVENSSSDITGDPGVNSLENLRRDGPPPSVS